MEILGPNKKVQLSEKYWKIQRPLGIARTAMKKAKDQQDYVLKLKVTLLDTEPVIWRQIYVPERLSLKKLHEILQIVMGWQNAHLHEFNVGETRYSDLSHGMNDDIFEGDEPYQDESKIKLARVALLTDQFEYHYDFGDGWHHGIQIEERIHADPNRQYPLCTDGARACPPEDCGGPSGYEDLLVHLVSPGHSEHESSLRWVGGFFDSEGFDPNHLNREHLWAKRW